MTAWCSPVPYRLVRTSDSESYGRMSEGATGLPLPPHVGSFGCRRKNHTHEGVDLYVPKDTPVYAVEDGTIVAVLTFTGEHCTPPSPWWHNTWAVMVEGETGVVLYGEIVPSAGAVVGAAVRRGDLMGRVTPVLTKDKGRPMAMLHLELYDHGVRDCVEWLPGAPRPAGLRDPSPFLRPLAGPAEADDPLRSAAVHVIGGGTFSPVRNHLSLCAPAFGETAYALEDAFQALGIGCSLHLTRMVDRNSRLATNADIARLVDALVLDPETKIIVMNGALCDFDGQIGAIRSGWHAPRLKSREGALAIDITPADKVIGRIRERRPDIVVVGFKTTTGATADEQVALAKRQCAESGSALVLANDVTERHNILVPATAETLHGCVVSTGDRGEALQALAETAARLAGLL